MRSTWARCAEGHADAEFVGALGNDVGNDAVESHGGKSEGEHGEGTRRARLRDVPAATRAGER